MKGYEEIHRRRWLAGAASLAALSWLGSAGAMGRIPVGGELSFQLPHDTSSLDPNDPFDPLAALLGHCVFETVFRLDRGTPYPSLSDGLPVRDEGMTRVRLRPGLHSGRGHSLLARDLIDSIERSRRSGGSAVLLAVPKATVDRSDRRVALFRNVEPLELARALASPIVPLLSTRSSLTRPDGTGPFVANPGASAIVLERNTRAARGPAFLSRVRITAAPDIRAPLRAFEAKKADIGWLGSGLHQARSDAVPFDFGAVAWVVLRTGREAGSWNAPGVAQRLIDAIQPSRLAHLALGPLPPSTAALSWGGPATKLLVTNRSPYLLAVANTLASILSRPGHEVQMVGVPSNDIAQRRASRGYGLMVDIVRPMGPPGMATLVALATADDPARARSIIQHPPRLGSFDPRVLTRTLHLGVLGGLQVSGATAPHVALAKSEEGGWDLGATYRRR